jgi:hypothetical protein
VGFNDISKIEFQDLNVNLPAENRSLQSYSKYLKSQKKILTLIGFANHHYFLNSIGYDSHPKTKCTIG